MPLTRFPHGVSSFGIPQLGSGGLVPTTTGTYYFVDSATGSANNDGLTPTYPLDTVDHAVNKCTANKGDVIIVMPNHTENLASAGALTLDIAGVTVVGLGTGEARPTLIHTADTADINITGANVTVRNIKIESNTADVTVSVDIDAKDVWLDGIEWSEGSSLCFKNMITTGADNVCDGLKITACKSIGADSANLAFLNCEGGDLARLVMIGNHIRMKVNGTETLVELTGKSFFDCIITHNYFHRQAASGVPAIETDQTDNTGICAYNLICTDDCDAATPFDLQEVGFFENYQIGAPEEEESALLLPGVNNNA